MGILPYNPRKYRKRQSQNTPSIFCSSSGITLGAITGWEVTSAGGASTCGAATVAWACGACIAGARACCIPSTTANRWVISTYNFGAITGLGGCQASPGPTDFGGIGAGGGSTTGLGVTILPRLWVGFVTLAQPWGHLQPLAGALSGGSGASSPTAKLHVRAILWKSETSQILEIE